MDMYTLPPFIQNILFRKSLTPFFLIFIYGSLLVLATQMDKKIITMILLVGLPYLMYLYRTLIDEYVLFIECVRSYEMRILEATTMDELDEVSFDLTTVLSEEKLGGEAKLIRAKIMELLPVQLKLLTKNDNQDDQELTNEVCRSMFDEMLMVHKVLDTFGVPVNGIPGNEPLLVKRVNFYIKNNK